MRFDCARTCHAFERCRFHFILDALGLGQTAFSHTTKVKVELRNIGALAAAIVRMGGVVIGQGDHRLFSSHETGFGFTLPNWYKPLVLHADSSLAYDAYGGVWGDEQDIGKLTALYAIECARLTAIEQGWYCEESGANLVIYHPTGGTLTVTPEGICDASGFVGAGCHAFEPIELALGSHREVTNKPEGLIEQAHIHEGGS